ncbi:hypothetical protein ADUPG1_006797 [Aduncisulcus paluster]|uniref:Calpain catalytic domain-containing protein n=1 Tax=Aduncisulcus paluster TaxID=2918883 RepID=A0ABQ5KN43_9EUKA|nr:hypothetical protein ADUPG1_006797 [Aduncisulcus paluster]
MPIPSSDSSLKELGKVFQSIMDVISSENAAIREQLATSSETIKSMEKTINLLIKEKESLSFKIEVLEKKVDSAIPDEKQKHDHQLISSIYHDLKETIKRVSQLEGKIDSDIPSQSLSVPKITLPEENHVKLSIPELSRKKDQHDKSDPVSMIPLVPNPNPEPTSPPVSPRLRSSKSKHVIPSKTPKDNGDREISDTVTHPPTIERFSPSPRGSSTSTKTFQSQMKQIVPIESHFPDIVTIIESLSPFPSASSFDNLNLHCLMALKTLHPHYKEKKESFQNIPQVGSLRMTDEVAIAQASEMMDIDIEASQCETFISRLHKCKTDAERWDLYFLVEACRCVRWILEIENDNQLYISLCEQVCGYKLLNSRKSVWMVEPSKQDIDRYCAQSFALLRKSMVNSIVATSARAFAPNTREFLFVLALLCLFKHHDTCKIVDSIEDKILSMHVKSERKVLKVNIEKAHSQYSIFRTAVSKNSPAMNSKRRKKEHSDREEEDEFSSSDEDGTSSSSANIQSLNNSISMVAFAKDNYLRHCMNWFGTILDHPIQSICDMIASMSVNKDFYLKRCREYSNPEPKLLFLWICLKGKGYFDSKSEFSLLSSHIRILLSSILDVNPSLDVLEGKNIRSLLKNDDNCSLIPVDVTSFDILESHSTCVTKPAPSTGKSSSSSSQKQSESSLFKSNPELWKWGGRQTLLIAGKNHEEMKAVKRHGSMVRWKCLHHVHPNTMLAPPFLLNMDYYNEELGVDVRCDVSHPMHSIFRNQLDILCSSHAQGELPDCQLLSTVTAIINARGVTPFLKYINEKEGMYTLRYVLEGDEKLVRVDDSVPLRGRDVGLFCKPKKVDASKIVSHDGKGPIVIRSSLHSPLSGHISGSSDSSEQPKDVYFSLLPIIEKSFARMYGSFNALENDTKEFISMISSLMGVEQLLRASKVFHNDTELKYTMKQALSLLTRSSGDIIAILGTNKYRTTHELSHNHAFRLISVHTDSRSKQIMACIRNPHGHTEFTGSYGPQDTAFWDSTRQIEYKYTPSDNNGIFWIRYSQILDYFESLNVLIVPTHSRWKHQWIHGRWMELGTGYMNSNTSNNVTLSNSLPHTFILHVNGTSKKEVSVVLKNERGSPEIRKWMDMRHRQDHAAHDSGEETISATCDDCCQSISSSDDSLKSTAMIEKMCVVDNCIEKAMQSSILSKLKSTKCEHSALRIRGFKLSRAPRGLNEAMKIALHGTHKSPLIVEPVELLTSGEKYLTGKEVSVYAELDPGIYCISLEAMAPYCSIFFSGHFLADKSIVIRSLFQGLVGKGYIFSGRWGKDSSDQTSLSRSVPVAIINRDLTRTAEVSTLLYSSQTYVGTSCMPIPALSPKFLSKTPDLESLPLHLHSVPDCEEKSEYTQESDNFIKFVSGSTNVTMTTIKPQLCAGVMPHLHSTPTVSGSFQPYFGMILTDYSDNIDVCFKPFASAAWKLRGSWNSSLSLKSIRLNPSIIPSVAVKFYPSKKVKTKNPFKISSPQVVSIALHPDETRGQFYCINVYEGSSPLSQSSHLLKSGVLYGGASAVMDIALPDEISDVTIAVLADKEGKTNEFDLSIRSNCHKFIIMPSQKILAVFGHPKLRSASSVNKGWLELLEKEGLSNVTIHEVSKAQTKPFQFDIKAERKLISEHDKVLFIFPFYWFTFPPLIHKWMEDVFGMGIPAIRGKDFQILVSVGVPASYYAKGGSSPFTCDEYFAFLQSMCSFSGMKYLPSTVSGNDLSAAQRNKILLDLVKGK